MEALLAAYGGVTSLWNYNKGNWMFDKQMRQNALHQLQNMKVSQAGMYRDDLRDLFGLTIAKMDAYTTVVTLQLGFCISLYYDGRLNEYAPSWVFALHALSLGSAFVFFVLSLWFAVYASIAAQSCVVRTLTQALRLPIARETQVLQAHAFASDFEQDGDEALRLPFLLKGGERKLEKRTDIDNQQ